MSIALITILSTLGLTIIYAGLSAWMEGEEIDRRIRTKDKRELDHGKLLIQRVIVLGVLVIAGVILIWNWWALLLAPMAWGSFVPLHRFTLNKDRNLDWWHMDDMDKGGNWYDEMWWKVWGFFHGVPASALRSMLPFIYERREVARIAYLTEVTALAVSLTLLILKTI